MTEDAAARTQDWPLRPWILSGLLALCGLAIAILTDGHEESAARVAGAAFFFFGGISFALSLEDEAGWKEPAIFSAVLGLVLAGLTYNLIANEEYYSDAPFSFSAGIFASLLALPLFQAGFYRLRFNTPYRETHFHVWTDAISGAGSQAFVGLSWLLLVLLSELFDLLKITLLKDLIDDTWFAWAFSGAALGGAMGVLRNQLGILGTLQKVVMLVFGILAVPLAVAMVIFFMAVAISGLDVLWDATQSATPLLLSCAAGSFILVNAIVRDSDEDMSQSRIQRIAALVLALGMLPLALFAAISMGVRINQHGLSPERLWALVAIAVAVAYGLACLVVVVRGRMAGWGDLLRRANLNLAVGVSAVALFLALPILDFGAISTSNQISRLESGAVSAEDFDYSALRWDFGDAGRRGLARLAKSDDATVAQLAKEAGAEKERTWQPPQSTDERKKRLANLQNPITDPALHAAVERAVSKDAYLCSIPCAAIDLGTNGDSKHQVAIVWAAMSQHFQLNEQGELESYYPTLSSGDAPVKQVEPGTPIKVEVREVTVRRIYVNGQPVGEPFK